MTGIFTDIFFTILRNYNRDFIHINNQKYISANELKKKKEKITILTVLKPDHSIDNLMKRS